MTGFEVPAGGEVFKCQDFASPFHGQTVDITRFDVVMSPGSHHMVLDHKSRASDGPVVDCPAALPLEQTIFIAQTPSVMQTFPDGVGVAVPAGAGFSMNSHYINAGASPIQPDVRVTMDVARPGLITQHAGFLQYFLTSLAIPPTGQPATVSGSCSVSQDLHLISAVSHMHRRATHFVATSGDTMLYQTDSWAEPLQRAFSPPLFLGANSVVDWSCTYVNDTGETLVFALSAETGAMCNFMGMFYPAMDVSNPSLECAN